MSSRTTISSGQWPAATSSGKPPRSSVRPLFKPDQPRDSGTVRGAYPTLPAGLGGWIRRCESKVRHLLSPPGFTQYNGSCESRFGAMKNRTMWKAALSGRPRERTIGDLEAAQIEANEIPPGPGRPSPGESWGIERRSPGSFGKSVLKSEDDERGWLDAYRLPANPQREAQMKRTVIRRALVAHGLFKVKRRWIPLTKNRSNEQRFCEHHR
jgi:hypothetical protein